MTKRNEKIFSEVDSYSSKLIENEDLYGRGENKTLFSKKMKKNMIFCLYNIYEKVI